MPKVVKRPLYDAHMSGRQIGWFRPRDRQLHFREEVSFFGKVPSAVDILFVPYGTSHPIAMRAAQQAGKQFYVFVEEPRQRHPLVKALLVAVLAVLLATTVALLRSWLFAAPAPEVEQVIASATPTPAFLLGDPLTEHWPTTLPTLARYEFASEDSGALAATAVSEFFAGLPTAAPTLAPPATATTATLILAPHETKHPVAQAAEAWYTPVPAQLPPTAAATPAPAPAPPLVPPQEGSVKAAVEAWYEEPACVPPLVCP